MCNVQIEPVLQDITGEQLSRRTNKAPEARLDIRARGFWERQRFSFFDVRVCHPNADLYQDLEPHQIYEYSTKARSVYMGKELEKLNMVHLHHWSSPQPEVWEKNAANTLTD